MRGFFVRVIIHLFPVQWMVDIMTKKTNKDKDVGGRPTKYDKTYHPSAAKKLMARHGYTMEELADFFCVATSTIYEWQNNNPEFSDSVKAGRKEFDNERVVQSLLKRSLGYDYEEKSVEGSGMKKRAKVTTRHVPADVSAMKFWLKNRDPDNWKEKVEHELPEGQELVPWTMVTAKVDK